MSSAPWRTAVLATILLSFSASRLAAQTWDQVGERAQGMAGAFVAVADDSTAAYWNPAGLATGSTFDAQVSAGDERKLFLGAAMPALGFSYYRIRSVVNDSGSRKTGGSGEVRVSVADTGNFGVSLLQTVVNGLVIGSTLRLVSAGDTHGFDADLGAMGSVGPVRVGITARNLRETVDAQRRVRLGTAWVPRSLPKGVHGPFSLSFDVDLNRSASEVGGQREAALGSEQWWLGGSIGTRVGVRWNVSSDAKPALAGGLTVKLPYSVFAEGHVTKGAEDENIDWGFGGRVTF